MKRGGVTGPVGFVRSPLFSGNYADLLQLERLRFSDNDHGSIARKIGPIPDCFHDIIYIYTRAKYRFLRSNFRFNRIVENTLRLGPPPSTNARTFAFSFLSFSSFILPTSPPPPPSLSSIYLFIFLSILRATPVFNVMKRGAADTERWKRKKKGWTIIRVTDTSDTRKKTRSKVTRREKHRRTDYETIFHLPRPTSL